MNTEVTTNICLEKYTKRYKVIEKIGKEFKYFFRNRQMDMQEVRMYISVEICMYVQTFLL